MTIVGPDAFVMFADRATAPCVREHGAPRVPTSIPTVPPPPRGWIARLIDWLVAHAAPRRPADPVCRCTRRERELYGPHGGQWISRCPGCGGVIREVETPWGGAA